MTRPVHLRRVAEICYYISMLFWTRHANLRRVENYIYDPSARIIKNPLNSTVFWKRRLNPATRRLNSATRPLNSATRQILH